ncbi:MAG: TerC/Alx family metal homeostasis membrane protein [Bacteroidota bacterium]|nr:TerC/Alx family metal homeostasis membrane protein [Bacteroidota bacterium]MDP4232874.1 TerC/Alx family metal homeostasis membrane protein [Bacteroidota bacterium]MDP4241918.1 TerC/Alx family metal homeostasis membrane protein [Bacteroidota bacterium]MDP4288244.1 TerC/Alx family metal homeostasis membrane protein [Bacteroidota bacterium]
MSFQKALAWSLFWIGLSLLVAIGIYYYAGPNQAEAFVTGYLLEKSLSFDNLFIFLMLFTHFGVSASAQRRALNYGIIGVLVLRGVLIFVGVALVDEFDWLMYAFGAIVLYSGFVMLRGSSHEFDPATSRTIRLVSKMIKIAPDFHGTRFFVRAEIRHRTRLIATPLFLVLAVIEVMDIIFAVDSIPAIFSVTRDPFIIYASNMLAVLGLRSMYFLLVRVHEAFRFVKQGVGVILWFIGIKMLLPAVWPNLLITNTLALAVVTAVLLTSILLSVTIREKQ